MGEMIPSKQVLSRVDSWYTHIKRLTQRLGGEELTGFDPKRPEIHEIHERNHHPFSRPPPLQPSKPTQALSIRESFSSMAPPNTSGGSAAP